MEIVTNSFKAFIKIIDDIYNAGYMLYFIIGLVVLVIIVIVYN